MKYLTCLLMIFLTACNSKLPVDIQYAPAEDLQLKQVVNAIPEYKGKFVRWGGEIITVTNDDGYSLLEIKQLSLNSYGFPQLNKPSYGRFIAKSKQVFDPEEYQEGLLITFSGVISAEEKKQIRKRKEVYLPIIEVTTTKLWPYYKSSKGKAYTVTTPQTSRYRRHGYHGSGDYTY
jgi:starvation-inducible outer membrane lipoprotein